MDVQKYVILHSISTVINATNNVININKGLWYMKLNLDVTRCSREKRSDPQPRWALKLEQTVNYRGRGDGRAV